MLHHPLLTPAAYEKPPEIKEWKGLDSLYESPKVSQYVSVLPPGDYDIRLMLDKLDKLAEDTIYITRNAEGKLAYSVLLKPAYIEIRNFPLEGLMVPDTISSETLQNLKPQILKIAAESKNFPVPLLRFPLREEDQPAFQQYLQTYKESLSEEVVKANDAFKKQFFKLLDAFSAWGKSHKCKFAARTEFVKRHFFSVNYSGLQKNSYFEAVKARMEKIWFMINSRELSQAEIVMIDENLDTAYSVCAPGFLDSLNCISDNLDQEITLSTVLHRARTELIESVARIHVQYMNYDQPIPLIPDGNVRHVWTVLGADSEEKGFPNSHAIDDPLGYLAYLQSPQELANLQQLLIDNYTPLSIVREVMKVFPGELVNALGLVNLNELSKWHSYKPEHDQNTRKLLRAFGLKEDTVIFDLMMGEDGSTRFRFNFTLFVAQLLHSYKGYLFKSEEWKCEPVFGQYRFHHLGFGWSLQYLEDKHGNPTVLPIEELKNIDEKDFASAMCLVNIFPLNELSGLQDFSDFLKTADEATKKNIFIKLRRWDPAFLNIAIEKNVLIIVQDFFVTMCKGNKIEELVLLNLALSYQCRELILWLHEKHSVGVNKNFTGSIFFFDIVRFNTLPIDLLRWLAKNNLIDFSQRNSEGATVLHILCEKDDFLMRTWLLTEVPEVKELHRAQDSYGDTPLHHAVQHGNEAMVENLMIANYHCMQNEGKQTPLDIAVSLDNNQLIELLTSYDLFLGNPNPARLRNALPNFCTLVWNDIAKGMGFERIRNCFQQSGSAQDFMSNIPNRMKSDSVETCFECILQDGKVSDVEYLVREEKISLGRLDSLGNNWLHKAILANRLDIVEYLISNCIVFTCAFVKNNVGKTEFDLLDELPPSAEKTRLIAIVQQNCLNFLLKAPSHMWNYMRENFSLSTMAFIRKSIDEISFPVFLRKIQANVSWNDIVNFFGKETVLFWVRSIPPAKIVYDIPGIYQDAIRIMFHSNAPTLFPRLPLEIKSVQVPPDKKDKEHVSHIVKIFQPQVMAILNNANINSPKDRDYFLFNLVNFFESDQGNLPTDNESKTLLLFNHLSDLYHKTQDQCDNPAQKTLLRGQFIRILRAHAKKLVGFFESENDSVVHSAGPGPLGAVRAAQYG